MRVSLQNFWIVTVADCKEKIFALAKIIFGAADDHRAICIADFFSDHPDGVGPSKPQGLSEVVRPVIKFTRGFENAALGVFGERAGCGRIVERGGDRTRRQAEMLREGLKCSLGLFSSGRPLLPGVR